MTSSNAASNARCCSSTGALRGGAPLHAVRTARHCRNGTACHGRSRHAFMPLVSELLARDHLLVALAATDHRIATAVEQHLGGQRARIVGRGHRRTIGARATRSSTGRRLRRLAVRGPARRYRRSRTPARRCRSAALARDRECSGTMSCQASYSEGRIRSFIAASTTRNARLSPCFTRMTRVSSTPASATR